jgi:2-polyprenyl-3-methyl-5-hydroxy-6-metoxy-1,4-benzoquinol methylase
MSDVNSDRERIQNEIAKRQPFAMQIDVHGVMTQYASQIPVTADSGESIQFGYHPLNLWESIKTPLIQDVKGQRILDVGCNAGFFSFELAKRGGEVLGVDVNQVERVFNRECMPLQQAEWIESELKTGAKFKEMDFMDCDESEPYDKILFLGVYYHLEDPSRGLAKLNRLLKMGGELYVESETNPTETNYYPDDTVYRLDASNFLVPTPEYLNADMKRNGFEIVEVFRTKEVCCGNRYAFRAVKVSDNPQPQNTFGGVKDEPIGQSSQEGGVKEDNMLRVSALLQDAVKTMGQLEGELKSLVKFVDEVR